MQNEVVGQQANATAAAKSNLSEVSKELETLKLQNAELLAEKHSMEEAVTSLVRQTQELRHENEEQVAFLTQVRDSKEKKGTYFKSQKKRLVK
jgi:hypothetical protein